MRALPDAARCRASTATCRARRSSIQPHLDLAAQLGVTVASISETIRIATLGDLDQNSAKFSLADRQVPIRVSLIEDTRAATWRRSRTCRCPPPAAALCR